MDEAGEILRIVAREWRDLVAGSEGFLTGRTRAGCEGRDVVWGEMVSRRGRVSCDYICGNVLMVCLWNGCRT